MTAREHEIKAAQDAARYNDTLILQKVNASHRIAFADKYPNQVEHILRLITERLQLGLTKLEATDLHDPKTWILSCDEIESLAQAMFYVHQVRQELKAE